MTESELRTFKISSIKNLHIYGRTGKSGDSTALFWTASGISVESTTGELWAELEGDYETYEPWVSVWINGKQVSRFIVEKGRRWYCLFRGLSPKQNRFTLLKETQAMSGDERHMLLVHALGVPKNVEGKSDEIFLPQKERSLRIEFVGDSITTGEGLYGATDEMDWISGWMGLSENYALSTAKNLDADFRILSQSGWGVVSGWDNNRNSTMPRHYGKICSLAPGERNRKMGAQDENDFEKWKPDFVIVNLGTNDWGAFNNPPFKDEKSGVFWKLSLGEDGKPVQKDLIFFKNGVKDFITQIREKNPEAKIIWAYGMCGPELGEEIKQSVEEYKKESGDSKVDFILLDSMQNESDEEKGSRMHPGKGTHSRACKILCGKIRELTEEKKNG